MRFRSAATPHAKGKIEREHLFWQNRLPAYFAAATLSDLAPANPHIRDLRLHRNPHEVHRELQRKPQVAGNPAQKENRSARRPVPRCPWGPCVGRQRPVLKVGDD
ncbi:MAG TPA: hypothetical protein VI136_09720, partial [Verrucomicrobiae bacterium]